jgi:hypothetical protein
MNENIYNLLVSYELLKIKKSIYKDYFLRLPYGIFVMLDWKYTFNGYVMSYLLLLAHLNSAFNPIMYGVCSTKFRRGYQIFLYKIIGKELIDPMSKDDK